MRNEALNFFKKKSFKNLNYSLKYHNFKSLFLGSFF